MVYLFLFFYETKYNVNCTVCLQSSHLERDDDSTLIILAYYIQGQSKGKEEPI